MSIKCGVNNSCSEMEHLKQFPMFHRGSSSKHRDGNSYQAHVLSSKNILNPLNLKPALNNNPYYIRDITQLV